MMRCCLALKKRDKKPKAQRIGEYNRNTLDMIEKAFQQRGEYGNKSK